MLSVALCTYNGERYIREQLESILNQTMPVDEIVVCDDGSTDGTLQIIENLRSKTSVNFQLYKNEKNLGVSKNFKKAIDLCRGEIVFLSDQDDVWLPEKVESMVDLFMQHPEIQVVFSDALLINSEGNLINAYKNRLWDYTFHTSYRRLFDHGYKWECFLEGNVAPGSTMAVKKDYCDHNPFVFLCDKVILHDYAICLMAAKDDVLSYVDKPLTQYRLYANQTCGISNKSPFYSVDEQIYIIDKVSSLLSCTEDVKNRKDFVRFRIKTANRFLGCLMLICSIRRYRAFYRKESRQILFHDVERWGMIMLDRVFPSRKSSPIRIS